MDEGLLRTEAVTGTDMACCLVGEGGIFAVAVRAAYFALDFANSLRHNPPFEDALLTSREASIEVLAFAIEAAASAVAALPPVEGPAALLWLLGTTTCGGRGASTGGGPFGGGPSATAGI